MKLAISQLPEAVYHRLAGIPKDAQAQLDGFFQKAGGRAGAITGLVLCLLTLLIGMVGVLGEDVPLLVPMICGALLGVGIWASLGYMRRFGRSSLRPFVYLNPLYFVRVTLDEVRYHSIWRDLTDLRITHHHTNGVYTHTHFQFSFGKQRESLMVRPKKLAEELAQRIQGFREQVQAAANQKDGGDLKRFNLFAEMDGAQGLNEGYAVARQVVKKRRLMTWAIGSAGGFLLGSIIGFAGYAMAQKRFIDRNCDATYSYAYSTFSRSERCERYFTRYGITLFKKTAQTDLAAVYRDQFEKNSTSAKKLREMSALTEINYVGDADAKQILALYQQQGQARLKALYDQTITKYRQSAMQTTPQARAAIVRLLELARDQGAYRVKLNYESKTERVEKPISLPAKYGNKTVEPMGPSFTAALNQRRESLISQRIKDAFAKVIPADVLEFADVTRYSRVKAESVKDAPLSFDVSYTVFPSGAIYVNSRLPEAQRRYYTGIAFVWKVAIYAKGEPVYTFEQISKPPPRFTVSTYSRYRTAASRSQIYDRMAATAFDNFSDRIVEHFGIPKATRRTTTTTKSNAAGGGYSACSALCRNKATAAACRLCIRRMLNKARNR